jgi:predicted metal-dependent enzyme (double-stranded beta helix superfamily)
MQAQDSMSDRAQRDEAVGTVLQNIRSILSNGALDRDRLSQIRDRLIGLAGRRELWGEADFPPPDEESRQNRYLISEDPGAILALYLNVMRPGKLIPPHNHTTWACVAAVEGSEHNYVYRRLDDGSVPGQARIEQTDTVVVTPGTAIALMPDDIHAVEIKGTQIIRHLHLYGRALETLDERLTFDLAAGTCRPMPLGVQTRR